jgi:ribosome biogenesis GTPase
LDDHGERYLCYLRGRIQRDRGRIMVGDRVELEATDPGEAIITEVLERTNALLRPPVANVDGLFVVFTVLEPRGNLELLDKRLVMAELSHMRAEVVLNKIDLTPEAELSALEAVYRQAGYPVWRVSSQSGAGLEAMLNAPRHGIWVLAGESGVGKSSLLRWAIPEADAPSQALSRIGRGKETTRQVGLWALGSFWLADAPGYTALKVGVGDIRDIMRAFPEFDGFSCRYGNCLHIKERDCGVQQAVEAGRLNRERYHHYVTMAESWVVTRY